VPVLNPYLSPAVNFHQSVQLLARRTEEDYDSDESEPDPRRDALPPEVRASFDFAAQFGAAPSWYHPPQPRRLERLPRTFITVAEFVQRFDRAPTLVELRRGALWPPAAWELRIPYLPFVASSGLITVIHETRVLHAVLALQRWWRAHQAYQAGYRITLQLLRVQHAREAEESGIQFLTRRQQQLGDYGGIPPAVREAIGGPLPPWLGSDEPVFGPEAAVIGESRLIYRESVDNRRLALGVARSRLAAIRARQAACDARVAAARTDEYLASLVERVFPDATRRLARAERLERCWFNWPYHHRTKRYRIGEVVDETYNQRWGIAGNLQGNAV